MPVGAVNGVDFEVIELTLDQTPRQASLLHALSTRHACGHGQG